jgi:hypothetical protein
VVHELLADGPEFDEVPLRCLLFGLSVVLDNADEESARGNDEGSRKNAPRTFLYRLAGRFGQDGLLSQLRDELAGRLPAFP